MASCADCDLTLEAGSGGLYELTRCLTDPLPDDDHLVTLEFVGLEIIDWTGPETPTTGWITTVVISSGWVTQDVGDGLHDYPQFCLLITIDADLALAENGEGTYTIRMIGRRAGTEDNVNCDFELCITSTQSFMVLYALMSNSLLNQVQLWRFPFGAGQDAATWGEHFWHQVIDYANDGGVEDNDASDVKGIRIFEGSVADEIAPFLVCENADQRVFSISMRGKSQVEIYDVDFQPPQHWAYDILQDDRKIAFVEKVFPGGTFDEALQVIDLDGSDLDTIYYPGTNEGAGYCIVYNWLDGYLYYVDRQERFFKIRPDGTDRTLITALTVSGSGYRMNSFLPNYGAAGGIVMLCIPPGETSGWYIFDVATETFALTVNQQIQDDFKTPWIVGEKLVTIGGPQVGGNPHDKVRVSDYDGTNTIVLPDVPDFAPTGFWLASVERPFEVVERLPGFMLRLYPGADSTYAAPDNSVREVYANDAGTVETAIGGECALVRDQGVRRSHIWRQTAAASRPLLQTEAGYPFMQSDGSDDFMTMVWSPGLFLQGDQISVYLVMRHDGWVPGTGVVFLSHQVTGLVRFVWGLDGATNQFYLWFGTSTADAGILRAAVPAGWADIVHLVELQINPSTDLMEIIVDEVTVGSKTRTSSDVGFGSSETTYLCKQISGANSAVSLWDGVLHAYNHTEARRAEARAYFKSRYAGLGGYFD